MISEQKLNELKISVELKKGTNGFLIYIKALSLKDISNLINAEQIYRNRLEQGDLEAIDPYLRYAESNFIRWDNCPVFMSNAKEIKVSNLKELFELRISDRDVLTIGGKIKESVLNYVSGRQPFEKK